jgi:hypothetical protein
VTAAILQYKSVAYSITKGNGLSPLLLGGGQKNLYIQIDTARGKA